MKRITILYDNDLSIAFDALDAWIEKCDDEFRLHYTVDLGGDLIRLPLTKYMRKICIDDLDKR